MVTLEHIKLLHDFLTEKQIDYVLTGSCALHLHGMFNIPMNDIDIIIPVHCQKDLNANINIVGDEYKRIISELSKQQLLSGLPNNSNYTERVIQFYVGNGIKVDAFVIIVVDDFEIKSLPTIVKAGSSKSFTVKLHALNDIMAAKFKMARPKDFTFFNKLIVNYSQMFYKK